MNVINLTVWTALCVTPRWKYELRVLVFVFGHVCGSNARRRSFSKGRSAGCIVLLVVLHITAAGELSCPCALTASVPVCSLN
jgi:hypothetical protein